MLLVSPLCETAVVQENALELGDSDVAGIVRMSVKATIDCLKDF